MSSKQTTLLNAWKKTKPQKRQLTKQDIIDITAASDIEDDDDDLLEAVEALEKTNFEVDASRPSTSTSANYANIEHISGFDNSAGDIWIYPKNYPVRSYQFSMVKAALFQNTLICLPTGLGKTHIAAVVMYNFYRWYPQGKIIFMAPTKPLVSQQIDSCYKVMGIPKDDTAQITGMTMAADKRSTLWHSKRVFFITPQVINNDLARGAVPAESIKCVVVDEAHKALGKYAYCQVIQQLASHSRNFRVVALSATPGTDIRAVQQVVNNLLISHIEMRTEDSIDIQPYSHQRVVEKVVCKLDGDIINLRDKFMELLKTFLRTLERHCVILDHDPSRYTKYGLLMARDQYRKNPPGGLSKYEMGSIEGDFAILISLYHSLELLLLHGMRSFFIHLKSMMEGDKGTQRAKSVLGANKIFRDLYKELTEMFGSRPEANVQLTQVTQHTQRSTQQTKKYVYSHPKVKKLEEIVVKHFTDFNKDIAQLEAGASTRVMVFSQYRDSVQEITELLQKHRPLVRPMQFIGHSTATGKMAKFTQKDQLKVVSKFRGAGYNVLVSTCVGEEGLDIGDVDLIVCFDSHKSPIRLVQRMGRTGRKRKGRIVMLVTEGKEEKDYNSSVSSRKSIAKAMSKTSGKRITFYGHNPRMVPHGLNPQSHQMYMNIPKKTDAEPIATEPQKSKKTKSKSMDISVMFEKSKSKSGKSFLKESELDLWKEYFENEEINLDALYNKQRFLCIKKSSEQAVASEGCVSLSKFPSWQTHQQKCFIVSHSTATEQYTELMEMSDFMKQNPPSQLTQLRQPIAEVPDGNRITLDEHETFNEENKSLGLGDNVPKETTVTPRQQSSTTFQSKLKMFKCDDEATQVTQEHDDIQSHSVTVTNQQEENAMDLKLEEPKANTRDIHNTSQHSAISDKSLEFIDHISPLPQEEIDTDDKNESIIATPNPNDTDDFSLEMISKFKDPLESTCKRPTTKRRCFDLGVDISKEVSDTSVKSPNTNVENSIQITSNKTNIINENDNDNFPDFDWSDANFSLCDEQSYTISSKRERDKENNDKLSETSKNLSSTKYSEIKIADKNEQNSTEYTKSVKKAVKPNQEKFSKLSRNEIDMSGIDLCFATPQPVSKPCKKIEQTPNSPTLVNKYLNVLTEAEHDDFMDSSLDLFGPEIDVNFDLELDFEDDAKSSKNTSMKPEHENNICKSSSKSDNTNASTSHISTSLFPTKNQSTINKTAELTLSQISENREFFKDLPRKNNSDLVTKVSAVMPVNAKVHSTSCDKSSASKQSFNKRPMPFSSDDDDFVNVQNKPPRKRKQSIANEKSSITAPQNFSPELLSQIAFNRNKKPLFIQSDSDASPSPKKPANKQTRRMQYHNFVENEAEVSMEEGVDISSDEHDVITDSQQQEMMMFVNDQTQLTQHVDEQALYMRSVKSPLCTNNARFKLAQNINHSMDVFSQEDRNDSDYMQDSFMNDEEVESMVQHSHEVTLLDDSSLLNSKQPVTRRQALLKKNKKPINKLLEKRRRIITMDDSTDAENSVVGSKGHTEATNKNNEFKTKPNDTRKEVKLSGSTNSEDWQCTACTLVNKPASQACASQACELCDSQRPETNTQVEKWTCHKCTYENSSTVTNCFMCNTLKPEQTQNEAAKTSDFPDFSHTPVSSLNHSTPDSKKANNFNNQKSPVIVSSTPLAKRKLSLNAESEREKRLRICKEKQNELRRKLALKKSENSLASSVESPIQKSSSSKLRKEGETGAEPPSIIVACKELSSAHEVVTTLRRLGSTHVVIASLSYCDYVLGVSTAAERMLLSELGNSINRKKICQRFQSLMFNYNKVYLILEQDRVKKGDIGGISTTAAKQAYINSSICMIVSAGIKVLYSNNQADTAQLLSTLAKRESNLNHAIPKSVSCYANDPKHKAHIKLYTSMPRVTLITALFLCKNFESYKEVAGSSVEKLMRLANMTPCVAVEVYNFFRKKYPQ